MKHWSQSAFFSSWFFVGCAQGVKRVWLSSTATGVGHHLPGTGSGSGRVYTVYGDLPAGWGWFVRWVGWGLELNLACLGWLYMGSGWGDSWTLSCKTKLWVKHPECTDCIGHILSTELWSQFLNTNRGTSLNWARHELSCDNWKVKAPAVHVTLAQYSYL